MPVVALSAAPYEEVPGGFFDPGALSPENHYQLTSKGGSWFFRHGIRITAGGMGFLSGSHVPSIFAAGAEQLNGHVLALMRAI